MMSDFTYAGAITSSAHYAIVTTAALRKLINRHIGAAET